MDDDDLTPVEHRRTPTKPMAPLPLPTRANLPLRTTALGRMVDHATKLSAGRRGGDFTVRHMTVTLSPREFEEAGQQLQEHAEIAAYATRYITDVGTIHLPIGEDVNGRIVELVIVEDA